MTAPFVLLDDNLTPGGRSLLFVEPREIIMCEEPSGWAAAARRIEAALAAGRHVAGFASYELGYALEPKLAALMPAARDTPLLHFGVFDEARPLGRAEVRGFLEQAKQGEHALVNIETSVDRSRYAADFRKIQEYIRAGDIYQVNYTFGLGFDFEGDPISLYLALRRMQPVAHGGIVHGDGFTVLSLSPELFFELKDGVVTTRPMKGTARRAPTLARDEEVRAGLAADEKSRAENLMIVDLLRNDFSRIAEVGSVRVPELFTVETYRTLHQMTSTVTARLRRAVGFEELFRGVFPCGSITGAPKIRAMQIVRELESGPRGVYTGAIGYLAPDSEARFNVAIRTVMLRAGKGQMGIGSGLVADSDCDAEWRECLLKAEFLTAPQDPFRLFETMRWERGKGTILLEEHLDRLEDSARYFGFPCDRDRIAATLAAAGAGFAADACRVRLTLDEDGEAAVAATALPASEPKPVWRFALSPHANDPEDPFLYHKTTNRDLYDREHERAVRDLGCDEIVFLNRRGELTEGSRTNLFLDMGGRLVTPALDCGLLPGTLRRSLIETGRAAEAVLREEDLARADRIFLGNSVRGLIEARPVEAQS